MRTNFNSNAPGILGDVPVMPIPPVIVLRTRNYSYAAAGIKHLKHRTNRRKSVVRSSNK